MATRSDSSKEMRESLMASEGEVPDVRNSVPVSRYINLAYQMFQLALKTSQEGYVSRTYVAWKRFLIYAVEKLPKHSKFRVSDTNTEKFKRWNKEACDYAFDQLEIIVEQMDKEEDAARAEVVDMVKEVEAEDDDFLLDEFDGELPQPTASSPPPPKPQSKNLTGRDDKIRGKDSWKILKVLESECNDQLGGDNNESGALLYETMRPPAEAPPEKRETGLLGVNQNDRLILKHLLGNQGIALGGVPPPQRQILYMRFPTPHGVKQIAFHRHDFYISHLRFFYQPEDPSLRQIRATREAVETNRCFFIHLGIAINVHPFALQTYFRHVAATITSRDHDELQEDILRSVLQYSGFVDANALMYIWPSEMQRFRICLISGNLQKPIFCSFVPPKANVDTLDDIIIHSDGSHFTLLKPAAAEHARSFSVLSKLLEVARSSGCIVQEIPVEPYDASSLLPRSVYDLYCAATR